MKVTITEGKSKVIYELPALWNELTLGRYMRVMKVLKQKEVKNEYEKVINMINCLSKIPKKDIYSLDMKSINALGEHISTFLQSTPNEELIHFIKIQDIEYGFHPSLKDMTLGEFVDLETYMKDIDSNLHRIMSILYRPLIAKDEEGYKYAIEEYEPSEERADLFKKYMTVEEFNGASVFFCDLERQLLNSSLRSSIQKLKKKRKKRKEEKDKQAH